MVREPGLSVRVKLAVSYAAFLMLAGGVLLVAGYFSLSRGFHPGVSFTVFSHGALVRSFAPTAALVMGFLLVFGLLGGWVLAGRMLAPLARISEATRLVARGSLSHRIDMDGANDEFRELADSFDAMLERLEAHVTEQQRFAANASHELRTPLAITQTLLDVARKDPRTGATDLVERLHLVNARAINLTEALLVLSRADQRSFTREPVDLSLAVDQAVETLVPLAEKHGITIESSGEPASTHGSPALIVQLATNLLHNAIIHNSRDHGTVWVRTGTRSATAVLAIENTGEPLMPLRSRLLPNRSDAAPNASTPTRRASGSALRSSSGSPKRTEAPLPWLRERAAGSASRWRCRPSPRLAAGADRDRPRP